MKHIGVCHPACDSQIHGDCRVKMAPMDQRRCHIALHRVGTRPGNSTTYALALPSRKREAAKHVDALYGA